jgi:hypothetical protein
VDLERYIDLTNMLQRRYDNEDRKRYILRTIPENVRRREKGGERRGEDKEGNMFQRRYDKEALYPQDDT